MELLLSNHPSLRNAFPKDHINTSELSLNFTFIASLPWSTPSKQVLPCYSRPSGHIYCVQSISYFQLIHNPNYKFYHRAPGHQFTNLVFHHSSLCSHFSHWLSRCSQDAHMWSFSRAPASRYLQSLLPRCHQVFSPCHQRRVRGLPWLPRFHQQPSSPDPALVLLTSIYSYICICSVCDSLISM